MASKNPCRAGKHDPYPNYYVTVPCSCRQAYEEHCRKCGWYYTESDPCGEWIGCSPSSYRHHAATNRRMAAALEEVERED